MRKARPKNIFGPNYYREQRCLSCGTSENLGRRRYCSIECRQKLRYTLNIRTGLLRALNTRYATFYFTDQVIIMDVLIYGSKEIFSFMYSRSLGRNPAEDYSRMSDMLGKEWWAEKKRTNRNYLASGYLLKRAERNKSLIDHVAPIETEIPTIKNSVLTYLKLGKAELNSPDLEKNIKSAYRLQAKKHHPDLGGDTAMFRRVHQAYLKLIDWSENPSYMRRRGFPDKWFYDGNKNGWVQPTPRR